MERVIYQKKEKAWDAGRGKEMGGEGGLVVLVCCVNLFGFGKC